MTLLRDQSDVSGVTPMPVETADATSSVIAISAETVVWYYVTGGAFTAAATQAAGTVVTAKLAYTNLLNSLASSQGSFNDTSVVFGAATRAATSVAVPEVVFANMQYLSPTDQITEITKWLGTGSSGNYAIDHRRGQVWLRSKATVANDTVSYSVPTQAAGKDLKNDVIKAQVQASYTNLSASALIKSGPGQLIGICINSCAAGATIKVWDNTSAATTVLLNTITFTAAVNQGPTIIALPAVKFSTGCYVTIAVAAMDATVFWN